MHNNEHDSIYCKHYHCAQVTSMETTPSHPLINVTKEDIKKLRLSCGIDDCKKLKQDLDTVLEWCQKQNHLKEASEYLNYTLLERLFLISKGSVEATKQRLDKLLTSRGLMPELMLNRSIEEFETLWNCLNYVSLPKLCETDQSRVVLIQFLTDNLDDFSIVRYFRYGFMIAEFRNNFDLIISERHIVDLKNVNISIISKINPIAVKKAEILCSSAIGVKIKGIHFLNAPPFVDKVVSLLKKSLKEKIANRIQVHKTYEDLHNHIPKEILPKEYGGDEVSCSELAKKWKEAFKSDEAKTFIDKFEKLVSNEAYRQNFKFNEEYMGMPGSFKKLSID